MATIARPADTAQPLAPARGPDLRKVGLFSLVGMVVGSMIGGGAFNLPQNMAVGAGLGAVILAWIITGVGMFFLSNSFRTLADKRPELSAGIYTYGREGFGRFAGFQMAWGYWLSSAFGNVAFAVLVMQTLGYWFPAFGQGKTWAAIIGGSVLIWVMNFIVLQGVKRAALLNAIATVTKFGAVVVAAGILAIFAAGRGQFSFDVWGQAAHLGGVIGQVKSTMLVTLWVFIGIEGAVVISDRAHKSSDVGKATFLGLVVCLLLYALLSVLPFGALHQQALAGLKSPSLAYALQALVGNWGALFVLLSVLLSVLSCWLAWTILVAELPFMGARDGVFPKFLAVENQNHAPAPSLWLSSFVMQATMFVVLFASNAWLWLVDITGVMILPPYLASTAFLWKYAAGPKYAASPSEASEGRAASIWTGVLGSLYALWLLYAAGAEFVLMSTIVFAVGIPVFWYAQREKAPGRPAFTRAEIAAAVILVAVAIVAAVLFARGVVKIS
jgi:arginine:ornithine antiporter/lysine permease